LETLSIEDCKRLRRIDELATLTSLRSLKLANCGEIESLKPLASLRVLENLYAWESTRVRDGDLDVLLSLPRLKTIAMMSRGGYRPPLEEVERILAARG
jgi:hypothetical protein